MNVKHNKSDNKATAKGADIVPIAGSCAMHNDGDTENKNETLVFDQRLLAESLQEKFLQEERIRAKIDTECKAAVMAILRTVEIVGLMKRRFRLSGSTYGFDVFALGVSAYASEFKTNTAIVLSELDSASASKYETLSPKFIKTHIKPLFEELGIIQNRDAKNFRWADRNELKAIVDGIKEDRNTKQAAIEKARLDAIAASKPKPVHMWLLGKAGDAVTKISDKNHQRKLKKAERDAFQVVHKDGFIEVLDKPFKGVLTPKEKKIIQKYKYVEKQLKLESKIDVMTDKSFRQELKKEEQAMERERLQIERETAMKIAEDNARRAVTLNNLKPWSVVLVALVVAYYIFGTGRMDSMQEFEPQDAQRAIVSNQPQEVAE